MLGRANLPKIPTEMFVNRIIKMRIIILTSAVDIQILVEKSSALLIYVL